MTICPAIPIVIFVPFNDMDLGICNYCCISFSTFRKEKLAKCPKITVNLFRQRPFRFTGAHLNSLQNSQAVKAQRHESSRIAHLLP